MGKKSSWKQASDGDGQSLQEDIDWLNMPAVGREFGSPDYERLLALDQAAYAVFESWEQVRQWLATPNAKLGGACPEEAAQSPEGHARVMAVLMLVGKGPAMTTCGE